MISTHTKLARWNKGESIKDAIDDANPSNTSTSLRVPHIEGVTFRTESIGWILGDNDIIDVGSGDPIEFDPWISGDPPYFETCDRSNRACCRSVLMRCISSRI